MAIKLKKLSDKWERRLFIIGVFLIPILAGIAIMYWNYGTFGWEIFSWNEEQFFTVIAVVSSIIVIIWGGWEIIKINQYRKEKMGAEFLQQCKIDKIPLEIPVIGALAGGWSVWKLFADILNSNQYVMGMFLGIAYNVIRYSIRFFFLLVLLYGCLYILYRRFLLGTVKDTSFLCKRSRLYRERTPLEAQIVQKNRRGFLLCMGIQTIIAGIFFIHIFRYGRRDEIVFCGLILLVDILLFCLWHFNYLAHDMGLLVKQIQTMSQGEAIPEEQRIADKSLLYEADQNLANIEASMKKSVEKQMQAERLKVDLITNMSHDLKTPLTSMIGYTDLLKKEELSDAAMDYVDVISVKQEQLKNMIQDLFDLSKATSNVEQLNMEVLDMRKLLEQTLGDMEDQIEASGYTIRENFSQEALTFLGDNNKMYRVVQNLLENALKYSLANTRIYVEAGKKEGKIWACVKNIASYEMDFTPEEIMERFVRGDKARTTKGHGLGLAISSSYVRNLGGIMEVEIDGDLFKVNLEFPCAEEA